MRNSSKTLLVAIFLSTVCVVQREAKASTCRDFFSKILYPPKKRAEIIRSMQEEMAKGAPDPAKVLSLIDQALNKAVFDTRELSEFITGAPGALDSVNAKRNIEYYASRLKEGKKIAPWKGSAFPDNFEGKNNIEKFSAMKAYIETHGLSEEYYRTLGSMDLLPGTFRKNTLFPDEAYLTKRTEEFVIEELNQKIRLEERKLESAKAHESLMSEVGLTQPWTGVTPESGMHYLDKTPFESIKNSSNSIPLEAARRIAKSSDMIWDLHTFANRIEYVHGGNGTNTVLHFSYNSDTNFRNIDSTASFKAGYDKTLLKFLADHDLKPGRHNLGKGVALIKRKGEQVGVWYFLDNKSANDYTLNSEYRLWPNSR